MHYILEQNQNLEVSHHQRTPIKIMNLLIKKTNEACQTAPEAAPFWMNIQQISPIGFGILFK